MFNGYFSFTKDKRTVLLNKYTVIKVIKPKVVNSDVDIKLASICIDKGICCKI